MRAEEINYGYNGDQYDDTDAEEVKKTFVKTQSQTGEVRQLPVINQEEPSNG